MHANTGPCARPRKNARARACATMHPTPRRASAVLRRRGRHARGGGTRTGTRTCGRIRGEVERLEVVIVPLGAHRLEDIEARRVQLVAQAGQPVVFAIRHGQTPVCSAEHGFLPRALPPEDGGSDGPCLAMDGPDDSRGAQLCGRHARCGGVLRVGDAPPRCSARGGVVQPRGVQTDDARPAARACASVQARPPC